MSYHVVILSKTPEKLAGAIVNLRQKCCKEVIITVWDGDGEGLDEAQSLIYRKAADMRVDVGNLINVFGERPFIFSRNANFGIRVAHESDVLLLNDDARFETNGGPDLLSIAAQAHTEYGVVSATIDGMAAAEGQRTDGEPFRRRRANDRHHVADVGHHMLAFVCVYIRRQVLRMTPDVDRGAADVIGRPLDERFADYGFEDDDYCRRLTRAGLKLGVAPYCIVEHGLIGSSFRGGSSAGADMLAPNRARFEAKWKA